MARDMAIELKPHNVTSLSPWQNLTFTERAERNLARNPAMKPQTVTNRAITTLGADAKLIQRTGGSFIAAEVARDYGITDIDGKIIPSLRAERGSPSWQPLGRE
jgi:hypothetical protein